MWSTIKKLISGVTTALLFTLLIVTVFAVISTQAADGEPEVFGYQLKTVLSGSMEPGIQTGSIISIQPTEDQGQFEKGDVITFTNADDTLITHRIHEVQNEGQQYITKGDNNNTTDAEPVLAENVVGEYTGFTIPYVGYAIDFATSDQGAVLLLIVPGILLVIYSIVIIWRALRQMDNGSRDDQAIDEQ
ncbi:signal peptidase [Geomicrobium halophilum]|uniref:Signal peptidase I n=1 Tax=Geomicrobium halophilum TaxID=549000 RepID=A0A841PN02_9BACL|nr:signal peptidase I [Geomicrobium halophilum]MBB6450140.1 signal peptidase [Geomicrobium halophilum]